MSEEIKINKHSGSITFTNNGISFSQFGIAKEILDLITNLQQKVEQLEKENKELNRMCELYSQSLYNADLTKAEKKVEQLENIRKEAIEYIHEHQLVFELSSKKQIQYWFDEFYRDLLNILNKGSDK